MPDSKFSNIGEKALRKNSFMGFSVLKAVVEDNVIKGLFLGVVAK